MTNRCLLENCLTTWPVAPTDLCRDCGDPFARHTEACGEMDGYCSHKGIKLVQTNTGSILSQWACDCGEFVPKPEYCCDDHARIAKNLDDFDAIGDRKYDRDRERIRGNDSWLEAR